MIEDFQLNHNELDSVYMALSEINKYLEQHNKSLGDYLLPNHQTTQMNYTIQQLRQTEQGVKIFVK